MKICIAKTAFLLWCQSTRLKLPFIFLTNNCNNQFFRYMPIISGMHIPRYPHHQISCYKADLRQCEPFDKGFRSEAAFLRRLYEQWPRDSSTTFGNEYGKDYWWHCWTVPYDYDCLAARSQVFELLILDLPKTLFISFFPRYIIENPKWPGRGRIKGNIFSFPSSCKNNISYLFV